jgi:hypothetical protein
MQRSVTKPKTEWTPSSKGKKVVTGLMIAGLATTAVAGAGHIYHQIKGKDKNDDHKEYKRSLESASSASEEVVMVARQKITVAPHDAKVDISSSKQFVLPDHPHLTNPSHPSVTHAIVPYKAPAKLVPAKKGMSPMKKAAGFAIGATALAGITTLAVKAVKSHKKHDEKEVS